MMDTFLMDYILYYPRIKTGLSSRKQRIEDLIIFSIWGWGGETSPNKVIGLLNTEGIEDLKGEIN